VEIRTQVQKGSSKILIIFWFPFPEQVPDESADKDGKKTWKGKVAKQWKKMQQGNPPIVVAPYPEGGSIGSCRFPEFGCHKF
jgi:hypothetical protein